MRDERPIRPHPAYAMGGPNVNPEDVYGTYADFYKGRSTVGSTVSRRSGGKDKRKEKEKRREEKDRARTKDKSKSKAVEDSYEYEPPHSILIRTQSPSLPRRSSKSKKPFSPSPEENEYDPLEDIAVSSRISLETGRLTTPGQSRAASPDGGGGGGAGVGGRRRRRKSSAGLTTPPQSRGPSPAPPPPPPSKPNKPSKNATNGKKSGKAARLRGGAPSPSPPPIRRFGPVVAQPPPPSEATQGPLISLESEAGTYTGDAAGEAAFPALGPLPSIQFWMPPPPPSSHHPPPASSEDEDEDEDFPSKGATPKSVFLALGARRACVPYTPAFSGLDMRVVRPVSVRERLALRDAGVVLVRLGARVRLGGEEEGEREGGMGMWSLSYVGL